MCPYVGQHTHTHTHTRSTRTNESTQTPPRARHMSQPDKENPPDTRCLQHGRHTTTGDRSPLPVHTPLSPPPHPDLCVTEETRDHRAKQKRAMKSQVEACLSACGCGVV
mmetsp:Transcript_16551/g.47096  ORF Transcript_16551/g.47096 Transcript_16551/m.47096 type:complete len:109 (-) Transcript_16551:1042-1368(-)